MSAPKYKKPGLIIVGLITVALCVPMLIGAFGGYDTNKVWDPYTGEPLQGDDVSRCAVDGELLLNESFELEKLTRKWEIRARKWMVKCRKREGDLYQQITRERARLRHPE